MYIIDEKRFLALNFIDESDNESRLFYVKDKNDLLLSWSAHTRVSPIWPLISEIERASCHRDGIPDSCFVFFVGPINPANLDLQFGPNFNQDFPEADAWATHGVMNLVICTTSDEENDRLREFFKSLPVILEIWTLEDGVIVEVDIPRPINSKEAMEKVTSSHFGKTGFGTVANKELEFITTSLTAIHRGSVYYPWISFDVERIIQAYGIVVEDYRDSNGCFDPRNEADLVYALANINSGLSRFTSQCLSGTAPIRITECHFWPHSLLGIGLCNAALRKFIAFVEKTLGTYNLIERFKALKVKAASLNPPNIEEFKSLNRDLLSEVNPTESSLLVTPISFFSGRDNFKNDIFTVSAPLDTIAGLNSKKWSILTITHELSHRFVEPIISEMIPKTVEEARCAQTGRPKYSARSNPINFFDLATRDFLRCALAYAASSGFDVDKAKENEDDLSWLMHLLKTYHLHIEEIFVHTFDFLYFYNRSAKKYVPDIWNSWGILPQIDSKIDEYIVRTAAALSSNKVSINNPMPIVRKEILDNLPAPKDNPAAHLDEVRRRVASDEYWQNNLADRCDAAEMSARFVLQYIYSEEALSKLRGDETVSSSKKKYDYDLDHLRIDTREFQNPLSFLSAYATDIEPNETKSLWLHMMLAFVLDANGDG